MRFFTYKATDAKGRPANGTIQAASADDARLALVKAGWTVYDVQPSAGGAPTQGQPVPQRPAAQPQQRPAPTPRPAAKQSPQTAAQQPVIRQITTPGIVVNTPAPTKAASSSTKPIHPKKRTKRASDKERFFLFTQLAAAFRSGLNPVTTFTEIGQRSPQHFQESLDALSKTATEGGSLARTMAEYPDLYPEHVVGMTEAGQQGGFLPDAFEQISLQAQSAHKFKRWFFWIWFIFVNTLLALPGTWWMTRTLVAMWDNAEKTGGGEAGGSLAATSFWQTLRWPIGPAFVLICFLCWASYAYFSSRLAKRFRHRIGLLSPVYGKRARHENLSIFSWTLARLSHAGLAPGTAYKLAAETAPNLEMRDQLHELGARLTGAERMSQILGQSRLFPDEYVPIIATAEYTGDLPGALGQLSDMSRNEYQVAETYAKMRSGCWGLLALFVVGGIAMIMFCYTWYHELPERALKDTEWLQLSVI